MCALSKDPNPSLWPIFVINLDRSATRMAAVADDLGRQGLPFTRLRAVDGRDLSPAVVEALTRGAPRYKRPLAPSEIGCALSHLLAWDRIARGNAGVGVILEDDAQLFPGAAARLAKLAAGAIDWDLLKICHDANVSPAEPAHLPDKMPPRTVGYAITRAAAARLVERWVPFSRPIDTQMTYWWEHGACIKIAVPPLGNLIQDHEATSTIAPDRDHPVALHRFLANLRIQLPRRIARIWHHRTRPRHRVWPDRGPQAPNLPEVLAHVRSDWT